MEIEDKYLSAENCEDGDIITFVDSGTKAEIKQKDGSIKKVHNFMVDNGRYTLIYTPNSTAIKIFLKAWGRETENWRGKKFQIKLATSLSFGKENKIILPVVLA